MSTLIRDDKNLLQHVWSHKPYASGSVYPFGANRKNYPMLSWGKVSDPIGNVSPLLRGLSFLPLGCSAPSVCVTMPSVPDLEIDQKIMEYVERYTPATLYLY
jgi:hypothetical protein